MVERIYDYLLDLEKEGQTLRGVKVLVKSQGRAHTLVDRLRAFAPEDTRVEDLLPKGQPENLWAAYRKLALLCITSYIRDFPFLLHTPSSLRSVFGMPTRKDRKQGRYSGVSMISEALTLQSSPTESVPRLLEPNFEVIDELLNCLYSREDDPKYEEYITRVLNYLEKNLSRNALQAVTSPSVSTHSHVSLDSAKDILEDYGFEDLYHEGEERYEVNWEEGDYTLTPDVVGKLWDHVTWVEMKEWETFNVFFKPIKQLFAYMREVGYTAILVEKPVDFFEHMMSFINPEVSFEEFRNSLIPHERKVNAREQDINLMKKRLFDLGRLMVEEENLSYKAESLYIGLIAEFINIEVGMVNSELEAIRSLHKLVDTLSQEADEFLIIPLDQLRFYPKKPKQKYVLLLGVLGLREDEDKFPDSPILR